MKKENTTAIPTETVGSGEQCMGIEQAIKRFEKIMMSRIYVQKRLGDRLKVSIRTGMVVLFLLAVSILVLLMTLTLQVGKVTQVAENMNTNFKHIAANMARINQYMQDMESQVAFLPQIRGKTQLMSSQVIKMNQDMYAMRQAMNKINGEMLLIQQQMGSISHSVKNMNGNVGLINSQVHKMAKPANRFNKMFPF